MALFLQLAKAANLRRCDHRLRHHIRTFLDAKVRWVRDTYLDKAVEKEKNLKPLLALKNLIVSQPSKALSLNAISPLKPHLNLSITVSKFVDKYPVIFKTFRPRKRLSIPHVKITPMALALHIAEAHIFNRMLYRKDVAERLARLLMLTRAKRIPLSLIEKLKFDLGLPNDYMLTLLPDFPEYFQICNMGSSDMNDNEMFGLELVYWRSDLAVSGMEKRAKLENPESRRGMPLRFPMKFSKGFDFEKKVKIWVENWQDLPYISPYEDAFHLAPNSDQAEKWTVAVIHELLHLLVSKKTERKNIFSLGDYWGFGELFKKALLHHPGIFYVSNKLRAQTVLLREAYDRSFLVEKHPLMAMREKYIYLMNLVLRGGRPIRNGITRHGRKIASSRNKDKRKWKLANIRRKDK